MVIQTTPNSVDLMWREMFYMKETKTSISISPRPRRRTQLSVQTPRSAHHHALLSSGAPTASSLFYYFRHAFTYSLPSSYRFICWAHPPRVCVCSLSQAILTLAWPGPELRWFAAVSASGPHTPRPQGQACTQRQTAETLSLLYNIPTSNSST